MLFCLLLGVQSSLRRELFLCVLELLSERGGYA